MRCCYVAGLLLALALRVGADTLTDVTEPWAGRIAPLPPQRVAELEPATAARILETRDRIASLLTAAGTDPVELAAVYGRLGALYAAHRMYVGAELAWGNARSLDPQGFQWVYYSAHIALEQGEAERALAYLAQAARLDPDYPPLVLRRGEALLGLNRLQEARRSLAQAAEAPDLRAAALYGLAQIALLERDWADAAAHLREVLAMQPNAVAAHYPLGRALIGLGLRDRARDHLARRGPDLPSYPDPLVDELRSLQIGARFHFEQALTAAKQQDFTAAATAFAAGLAEQPANARARTSHARALWLAGRHDTAESELRRAIADGPAETLPRFLLAVVQDAAGDAASAVAMYREVLALDPDHQGALSYLANLHLRGGDTADAVTLFERAIAAGVTEMRLFLHYWAALRRHGVDHAQLRDRLVAFDRRFPEPPVFRLLLAKLLASTPEAAVADPARALDIARSLHTAQPIPPHGELLALALAASGDFEQAHAVQDDLVSMARMTGAWHHAEALEQTAAAYREGHLPEPPWPLQDPMLLPAPVDPDTPMRNYPAGQPY